MEKYFIDPYIISLLFQMDDEEKIQTMFTDLSQRVVIVAEKSTESFLKEKGLTEDQITEINQSENHDLFDENIKIILKDPGLNQKIEKNTNEFLKIYFDEYMPKMAEDKRAELQNYLKESNELRVLQNEEMKADLTETKELLEYYGAKDLNEAMLKAQDPNFKKESPSPSINLGGASTNNVSTTDVVKEETKVEMVEAPVTEEIKLPEMSNTEISSPLVDMALQSAVNPAQEQVFETIPEVAPIAEEIIENKVEPINSVNPLETITDTTSIPAPSSMLAADTQFTPLTEIPVAPKDEMKSETNNANITSTSLTDTQLPPLPLTESMDQTNATEGKTNFTEIDSTGMNPPTSAAARLDSLGISLDDAPINTQQ